MKITISEFDQAMSDMFDKYTQVCGHACARTNTLVQLNYNPIQKKYQLRTIIGNKEVTCQPFTAKIPALQAFNNLVKHR